MLFIFIKCGDLIERIEIPVYANADVAALSRIVKDLLVHTLLSRNHGSEKHELGSLGQCGDFVDDGVRRHLADLFAADGTVRNTDARVQKTEIVVDLRYRSDCGAWVFGGRFLINGDRRRQTVDEIHVGLIELSQKLSRIRGKRFHESSVSFRVKCIECKRGFTRAGKSRENDELVARNFHVHVFQIMHPRALNTDIFCRHIFLFPLLTSFLLNF